MGPVYEAVKMYQANQRVGWRPRNRGTRWTAVIRNPEAEGYRTRKGRFHKEPCFARRRYRVRSSSTFIQIRDPQEDAESGSGRDLELKDEQKSFSVIQALTLEDHKTKNFKAILDKIKLDGKTLVVQDVKDAKVVWQQGISGVFPLRCSQI
jgi:hypothetical protein